MTRAPAGPVLGEMAQVGLAGVPVVVVMVDPAVGWGVEAAVGFLAGPDDGPEEDAAAVWSALGDAQPVPARAATMTAVAMIRTDRMVIPPTATTLRAQDSSLGWAGHGTATDGCRGNRKPASIRSRSSSQ